MRRKLLQILLPMTACVSAVYAKTADVQQVFANPQANVDMTSNEQPSLSDLLTVSSGVSIFYGYLRESTWLVERLTNPLQTTTIFAPENSAIMALARRPHNGPPPVDEGKITAEDEEKRNADYLQDWTRMHMIAGTDVELAEGKVYESLAGDARKIGFKALKQAGGQEDWQTVAVFPGDARIVAKKVAKDGVLYILNGVLEEHLQLD